jgi:DNA-binding NtrC family response regulator
MADPAARPSAIPVVLLVDDEPGILDALVQEMEGSFKVFTAASVIEAEQLLAARRYDVIVCDHMLPGEQGIDFLSRVMDLVPSTKRILMTGYINPEFLNRSMAIGGLSSCLVKPIRTAEVAKAVRDALTS